MSIDLKDQLKQNIPQFFQQHSKPAGTSKVPGVSSERLDILFQKPEYQKLIETERQAIEAIVGKHMQHGSTATAPGVALPDSKSFYNWAKISISAAKSKGVNENTIRQKQNELLSHVSEIWDSSFEAAMNEAKSHGDNDALIQAIRSDPAFKELKTNFTKSLAGLIAGFIFLRE